MATTIIKRFPKTIEVFNKIAQKVSSEFIKEAFGVKRIAYHVTQKQYQWLLSVYQKDEAGLWDGISGVTLIDEAGTQYSFSADKFQYHVPHYIPEREKYGRTYTIVKHIKL